MFNEQYYDIVVVSSWPHVYEDKIAFLFNSLKYACAIPDIASERNANHSAKLIK